MPSAREAVQGEPSMQPILEGASPCGGLPAAGAGSYTSGSTYRRSHGRGANSDEETSLRDSWGNPPRFRQKTMEESYVATSDPNVRGSPYQTWDAQVSTPLYSTLRSADYRAVRTFLSEALRMGPEAAECNFQREKVRQYQDVWTEAREFAQMNTEKDYREEHMSAIRGYTLHRPNICKEFNDACRRATFPEAGQEGWRDFEYKSFWWLLMEAFFALAEDTEERVYSRRSGTSRLFRGISGVSVAAHPGAIIIFGQFLSTSQTTMAALKFTTAQSPVLLELRGVPRHLHREITRFGYYKHWEVLVAPFCMFRFAGEREDDGSRVMVLDFAGCVLESPGIMLSIRKRIADSEQWARHRVGGTDSSERTQRKRRRTNDELWEVLSGPAPGQQ